MIKLSIITVVYNAVETLEKTIKSVLDQTYENIEYIIVDGQSSDGTMNIVNQFQDKISCIISEPDDGIYDAMNKGVSHATGEVVAFLNSGDLYEQGTCQKVASYFETNKIDILIGTAIVTEKGEFTRIRENTPEKIELGMPCCHQAIFAKAGLFRKTGIYNTKYKICADYDWLLKVYDSNEEFLWIQDALVYYDAEGISANMALLRITETKEIALEHAYRHHKQERVQEIEHIYEQEREAILKNSRLSKVFVEHSKLVRDKMGNKPYYIWGTGIVGKRCYKLLRSAGVEIIGFIDSNKKYDKLHGCHVFYPDEVAKKEYICIASKYYEQEIYDQALAMGFDRNNLLYFGQLQKELLGNSISS